MARNTVDESKAMLRMCDLTSEPKRMLPPIKDYEKQQLVSLERAVQPLLSIVADIEEMVWTVKKNCQHPQDDLSSDESASIMLYTLEWTPHESSFYFILNNTLRSQNRNDLLPWFLYLRLFMFALSKLPSTKHRIIYRGIEMDASNEFPKGKTFIWWAFSSSTSSLEVLQQFLGKIGHRTIFNIECDSAKDISKHTFYQKENEILMYPARQFEVVSLFDSGNQMKIIHIKETQPLFPLIHIPATYLTNTDQSIQMHRSLSHISPSQHLRTSPNQIEEDDPFLSHIRIAQSFLASIDQIKPTCTSLPLTSPSQQFPSSTDQIKKVEPSFSRVHIPQASSTNTYQNEQLQQFIEQCEQQSEVNLEKQNLTDEDMEIVVKEAIINKQCKKLELGCNKITSVGASIIAKALNRNATLDILYLNKNHLSDKGIYTLATTLSLNNSKLSFLGLQDTGITDEGVKYIAEMLKTNTAIDRLLLSWNGISDQGVKILVDALTNHNTTLQTLRLSNNKLISDSSAEFLVEMLKQNKTLRCLDICNCKLSEKGKEQLRQITRSKQKFDLRV
jgi:Ran GTPase-activating protein (RanGAP) involved in mRNA processing and transport